MRYRELISEELVDYESNEEMVAAAQSICDAIKAYSKNLPIEIELRPEIVYDNCHGIVLTDLFADKPGSGVGKPLMQKLIAMCDEAGLNLYTDAEGPRSTDFYKKLGFESCSTGRHQLVCYPQYDLDEASLSPPRA